MTFLDAIVRKPVEKMERKNLDIYREAFDTFRPNELASIPVDTGERIIKKDGQPGRGKNELKIEKGFRDVARERQVGLQVSHDDMPNGKTVLNFLVGPKRESTPEQNKARLEGLSNWRRGETIKKLVATGMTVADATKTVDTEIATKKAAKLKAANAAKANGGTGQRAPK